MKKVLKKWWYLFLALGILIIGIIIAIFATAKTEGGVGQAGISNEEFRQIEIGKTTSYELGKIIDDKNEWENEETYNKCVEKISESIDGNKYTYVYKYYGERSGYAIITLQANSLNTEMNNNIIVIKKEKFDLK